MGIESVKNILLNKDDNIPPAECIIEALRLCLNCSYLIFNNQHYLQLDGTAQGPRHISCSCGDIAMYSYYFKALSYVPAVKCWKRFHDDLFVLLEHSRNDLDSFFGCMNSINSSKQNTFC